MTQLIAGARMTPAKTGLPAAAPLVPDPSDMTEQDRSRFNIWIYGPERAVVREFSARIVGTGRKLNESAIARAALRLLQDNQSFLDTYDTILAEDPRRKSSTGKRGAAVGPARGK